ncbi:MAG: class I SAM-dependent methyltransferase [Terriglobales bacterium]
MDLRGRILEEIRNRGPIPFSRYMELCLYEPELGFYSRSKEQFGKTGDFYTSSDVHAVFGRLLARQFDEMWRALDTPAQIEIVEVGPGRGLFAQDVLDWAKKKFPDFLYALHYTLVENSPGLRQRLQKRFQGQIGRGKVTVCSRLDEVPPGKRDRIVFCNEFFDALPVEVISSEGQLFIAAEGDRLVEVFFPPAAEVLEFVDHYGVHPLPGERVEAPLAAMCYMNNMTALIGRGFLVAIDYGYTREELLAGRHRGTVTAYRQHSVSATPYEAPGEQDITAHVNFGALRAAGLAAGLDYGCILTQAQFLMGIGETNQFADAFEDAELPQERAKVALQLKHLVTPAGMGEIFQVLVMKKGVPKEKAAQLSGLAFARKCT